MRFKKEITILFSLFVLLAVVLSINVYAQDNLNAPSMLPAPRVLNPLPPTVTPPPASPLAWNSRAFGYNAYGGSIALGPFKMWLSTPFGMTSLFTDPLSANFVEAGSFANGFWYGARYSTNALVKIDTTTGVLTTVATITGATSITGLAWDATTNTMYASDYGTSNKLGTLNLTTGVFTPLSGVVGTGLLIDIACSNNGTIYGHMITAPTTPSQIYTINKTTGVGTALPQTTGFNANYAQGMSWDHSVDTGYLSAYNYSTSTGELRKINAATGSTTLVGSIVSEVDGFAIPGGGVTPPSLIDPTTICNYSSSTSFNGFFGHACATLGDTLYVAGGSTAGGSTTTVYRYAINSGDFSTGVSLPTLKAGGVLVTAGTSMFYIGGSAAGVSGTAEGLSYKYTPATGWTSITATPNPKCGSVGMNWGDSVIFVVSGGWATFSPTVEYYRVAANTWGSSTPIPAGRRSFAGGLTNGKIFVSCGYNGAFLNDLRIGTIGADASTITWAVGPNVPFSSVITGSSRPGGTAVNGKFYMVAGEVAGGGGTNGCDSVFVFNATTNLWTGAISGRAPTGQGSNYWAAVCSKVLANGKIKIFIPGGAIGTNLPGLYAIQPDPCTVTGVINNSEVPKAYSLSQNYPNPFNPVTKISFEIPKSGLVTLKVYDILGKEVTTLVNEVKTPGNYIVDFNGTALSSGIYFYRLESSGFTSTKKMTLIK